MMPELKEALMALPSGKSPGADVFPKEFCLWGWEFIEPVLKEAICQMWDDGSMGQMLNSGLIVLLPKPRAAEGIRFWRPMTLHTTVYKILAKAMSRRLAPLMNGWVGKQQRGFIQGRSILDNIIMVKEAKWFAHKKGKKVILFSLDIEKAYDSVVWHFLRACLRKYGFGPEFRQWVEILLADAGSRVVVNDIISRWLRLGRRSGKETR